MSWIKRLLLKAVGGRAAQSAATVLAYKPTYKPTYKAVRKPIVVSDATRAMLREGFRSNASVGERSTRPLIAIPVTHAAPPPVQARIGGGQGSTTLPFAAPPAPAPSTKPRGPTSSVPLREPVLSGAAWLVSSAPDHGPLNPATQGGVAMMLWVSQTGEAPGPSAFSELACSAAQDHSPASLAATGAPFVDLFGGAPSWIPSEVTGRD